jgi:hypothetical protein
MYTWSMTWDIIWAWHATRPRWVKKRKFFIIGTGKVAADCPIDEEMDHLVLGAVAADKVAVVLKHDGD